MTSPADLALGVDVGGTKIAAGVVDLTTGEVAGFRSRPTPVSDGGAAVLDACVDLGSEVVSSVGASTPMSVGIGLCELVDLHGRPSGATTVDWRGLEVGAAFAALGPVTIESDVRAAASAECWFGAGRASGHVLYLTVSTGISYALVVNGQVYAGAHGNAILVGAPLIEGEAAGPAIATATGLAPRDAIADPGCSPVVRRAASKIGTALAFLVNALDPDVVVIGGGLGLNPTFFGEITTATRAAVTMEVSRSIPIRPALLGKSAGVVGAAWLSRHDAHAFERQRPEVLLAAERIPSDTDPAR